MTSSPVTHSITVYTDGGARGNPGPAGIGVYSPEMGNFKGYIGETTNNQAEYRALLLAFQKAIEYQHRHPEITTLNCFLDSELVVKQMNREYKVKDPGLQKLFIEIWNLKTHFQTVTFTHVRREYNKEADRLVNEAIDAAILN